MAYKKIQRYVNVEGLEAVNKSSVFIGLSGSYLALSSSYLTTSASYVATSASYNVLSQSYVAHTSSYLILSSSLVQSGSSFIKTYATASSFTAVGNNYYRITSVTSNLDIYLPSVSGNPHIEIGFKVQTPNMSGNVVTIYANGIDTIDGTGSYVMDVPRMFLKIKSDGVSDWLII